MRAIRHLVASAVNGLKPQRVSIVDETGRLLADGSGDQTPGGVSADERKVAFESGMRDQVESIVTSVVGPGPRPRPAHRRFRLQPHHPDLRPVRPGKPRRALEPDPRGNHGRGRQQGRPGHGRQRTAGRQQRPAEPPAGAQPPRDQNRKTEEIVNYEISRTTKTEVIEGGRLNRISVAVVVDGNYVKNDKGELAYEPRNKEEIDRIAALVRTAIGFDAKRGDQVEVANLRLAETPSIPIAEPPAG